MRDDESRHHTQTLEGLREHYATEAARALTQFSKETDRERDRTAKSVAENETLAIRLLLMSSHQPSVTLVPRT
jgi:hypothetical protein